MSNTPLDPSSDAPADKGWRLQWPGRARKLKETARADIITPQFEAEFGLSGSTSANLLTGREGMRQIRERKAIYDRWQEMEAFPICATGLGLLTTAALGGHESTGQLVFLEKNPAIKGDATLERYAQEIAGDLTGMFNEVAPQLGYIACWGGDSYVRMYHGAGRKGVVGLHMDEAFLPPMVQAYERGGRTFGFAVYSGPKSWDRLSVMQLARMKMPRMQFIPQHAVIEKLYRSHVTEDDREKAPVVPAMVGGSLLYPCEASYEDLRATLVGIVGSRIQDSINEEVLGLVTSNMNKDQQRRAVRNVIGLLTRSREVAMKAIRERKPVMERIRHLIPINGEKQLVTIMKGNEPRANAMTVEDLMVHARLFAAGMGLDLSMLGFADQMSGGLGEGGFFRNSAQVGERARVIRSSMSACFNHIIDVHTTLKYGLVFPEDKRPVIPNYFGAISALESERNTTRLTMVNTAGMVAQTLDQLRNLGWQPDALEMFMTRSMGFDEMEAKMYAAQTKPPAEGGFGGG